jgi:hypothetical protein
MAFTTKEEFEAIVAEAYKNLTEESFNNLLVAGKKRLKELYASGDWGTDKNTGESTFTNEHYKLNHDIFFTVLKSRRISLKQFKSLSAFVKMQWKTNEETEFKQF